jgi:hypothetical protein
MVIGRPLWNVTPSRMVNSQVLTASSDSQAVAISGWTRSSSSTQHRQFQTERVSRSIQ